MAKRTVKERVAEFRKKNPKAKFSYDEMDEIANLGNSFDIILTALYFGYMKGTMSKKGGAKA